MRTIATVAASVLALATPAHAAGTATVTGSGVAWPQFSVTPAPDLLAFSVSGSGATGSIACDFWISEPTASSTGAPVGFGEADCVTTLAFTVSCTSSRPGYSLSVYCTGGGATVTGPLQLVPTVGSNDFTVTGSLTFAP